MDPINIIVALNIIATFGANVPGAKKGIKSSVTLAKEKPSTYLQSVPVVLSTVILISMILGVFRVGTFGYGHDIGALRIAGLTVYLLFSWTQIWAYKSLGDSYSQDVLIYRSHKLVKKGPFKFIRHPQYISEILMNIGGGLATLSFIVLPLAIIQIPLLILRGRFEEKLLEKHFKNEYTEYKKKSGFFIPFIG